MGYTGGTTGPNFGLPWARATNVKAVATDYNRVAHVLEFICQTILEGIMENGVVLADPERCQFNQTTGRITAPGANYPILGIIGGRPFRMTSVMEESGTATAGDTTYLQDSGLSTSDDTFWSSGAYVLFTSGANSGEVRAVATYSDSSKQVTWSTPLSNAVQAGDTFTLTFFYVPSLTDGATNYIYIREGSALNTFGIPAFVATTSAVAVDTDLLIASAVIDGGGTITSVNNSPTGAARCLAPGLGREDTEVVEYEFDDLAPGATTAEITVDHETYTSCPGRVCTTDVEDVTVTVTESHQPDRLKLTLTNGGSYAASGTLTVTVTGKQVTRL